jgi:hypothetical protein
MPRVLGSANAHFQPCCPKDEDGDEDEDEDEDGDCSIRDTP